jgi:23S rRNA pseudouridine1911/1915/1917 synthase
MPDQKLRWIVEQSGARLDAYVTIRLPGVSRSAVQGMIAEGYILVNLTPAKAGHRLEAGDEIELVLPEQDDDALQAEDIPLDIVYEDDELMIVNKPAGMVVHPGAGHSRGTLVNALLSQMPDLPDQEGDRPGIVHRLDRDTSGLIAIAKTDRAIEHLQAQFKDRRVSKVYLALVEGRLQPDKGLVDAAIGRDPRQRQRMAVVSDGRPARTAYQVREHLGDHTFIEVRPETGRTHQIRVHLSAIGYPVYGDPIYGRRKRSGDRLFLHAWQLTLDLPSSGERRTFTAPLPDDLQRILDALKK